MIEDTSTPFFVKIVKFVLRLHSSLSKDRVQVFKIGTVEFY